MTILKLFILVGVCSINSSVSQQPTGKSCANGSGKIYILNDWIKVCFDEKSIRTIWVHEVVYYEIEERHRGPVGSSFTEGKYLFKHISMNNIYKKPAQKQTFKRIFDNDKKSVNRYWSQEDFYLEKGHLAAKADQLTRAEQKATFSYLNSVPMWKSINGGNWAYLEEIIRNISSDSVSDLDVWIGGVGVLRLKSLTTGKLEPIYLGVSEVTGEPGVPVPEFLFRYVINKKKRQGLVFITYNNPHIERLGSNKKLCKRYYYCDKFELFKDYKYGYTYCCTMESFFEKPIFQTLGLKQYKNYKPLKF